MELEFIAEIGVNHNGSLSRAFELIEQAILAGASTVKFQSFLADQLSSKSTPKAFYQSKRDLPRTHFEMLKALELSRDDQVKIREFCSLKGVSFLSTAYSVEDVKFLAELGVDRIKVASADIVDIPLHMSIVETGTPAIISTGMASLDEIKKVVEIYTSKKSQVTILHCVSEYPTPITNANMNRIHVLRANFDVPIGFSDHSMEDIPAIVALAMGCRIFEKHFTLSREDVGPDHAASANPIEFKSYCSNLKLAFESLGSFNFSRTELENDMAKTSRKSLHYSRDLSEGHILLESDLRLLRPGIGISYTDIKTVLGKTLLSRVSSGQIVDLKHFKI